MIRTTTFRRSSNPSAGYAKELWQEGKLFLRENISVEDAEEEMRELQMDGWTKTVEGRKIVFSFSRSL